jgi:hypothetical protein
MMKWEGYGRKRLYHASATVPSTYVTYLLSGPRFELEFLKKIHEKKYYFLRYNAV